MPNFSSTAWHWCCDSVVRLAWITWRKSISNYSFQALADQRSLLVPPQLPDIQTSLGRLLTNPRPLQIPYCLPAFHASAWAGSLPSSFVHCSHPWISDQGGFPGFNLPHTQLSFPTGQSSGHEILILVGMNTVKSHVNARQARSTWPHRLVVQCDAFNTILVHEENLRGSVLCDAASKYLVEPCYIWSGQYGSMSEGVLQMSDPIRIHSDCKPY